MPTQESATAHGAKKSPAPRGKTDWAIVEAKTDAEIERDVAEDPDAAPIFTDGMFANARVVDAGGENAER